jgi:ribonuclease BN (tRNA processing enzyme)
LNTSTIKLTVLGSGTGIPDGNRNSAGYFVETGDAHIMLDCGAGTLHSLARFGLPWQDLSHLFVSHFHVDHIGELAALMFAFRHGLTAQREQKLTLLGPPGLDGVVRGLTAAFGAKLFAPKFPVELKMLEPGDSVSLGPATTLRVAKTIHTEASLAVRIETGDRILCYTGDAAYDAGLSRFFFGADLLVSECSFVTRRPEIKHLSIEDAARLAASAEVRRLLLTHFYFAVSDHDLKKMVSSVYHGEIIVGEDGLGIEL